MAEEKKNDFTHVGVTKDTHRKIAILAKALDTDIYALVEIMAEQEWQSAAKAGLVTDAMLTPKQAHFVAQGVAEYSPADGKKLLQVVKSRKVKA